MSDDQLNHPDDRPDPTADRPDPTADRPDPTAEGSVDVGGHPRGTLAIVGIYGLLFVVGWLFIYFGVFLPRGPLTQ